MQPETFVSRPSLAGLKKMWCGMIAASTALLAVATDAQTIDGPIVGKPSLSRGSLAPVHDDYVVEEYFLSGNAESFVEAAPLTSDGKWTVRPNTTPRAPFVTRLIVARPPATKFNGTVVVEWLNVSGGADTSATWAYLHRELTRSGYVWVGVSAQRAGIDGGVADAEAVRAYLARQAPAAASHAQPAKRPPSGWTGKPLKESDAIRYGRLDHPGDAYAYDIFTQAGRAIRGSGILGPLKAQTVLATGASQSASYLVTYINAIDPLARVYDGYLIQVRKKTSAPIDGDVFAALRAGTGTFALPYVRVRDDSRVPVLTYISEQDLMAPGLGYIEARQPDNDHIRTWEVAGTSHGDIYGISVTAIDTGKTPISELAAAYAGADIGGGRQLAASINAAPQGHYVLQAGLSSLRRWVMEGEAPPIGTKLVTNEAAAPALVLDAHGNATGGVRTPWVDVPIATYAGIGDPGHGALSMMGSTEAFDAARLAQMYRNKADYLTRFAAALEKSISAGFILADDRDEILALAAEMYPTHKFILP